jgi:pimeloyl-ACP methyl ester carboxylesterase
MEVDVRYAMSGGARLAFRVRAGGPHVIVWVPGWLSYQYLEDHGTPSLISPSHFEELSSFATSVSYDQRGTGLSDPASLGEPPTLEGWADDLHSVVTTAGLEDVVLLGPGPAGAVAALYAATHPETDARPDLDQLISGDCPIRRL